MNSLYEKSQVYKGYLLIALVVIILTVFGYSKLFPDKTPVVKKSNYEQGLEYLRKSDYTNARTILSLIKENEADYKSARELINASYEQEKLNASNK